MTTLAGEMTGEKLAYIKTERLRSDTAKSSYNQMMADKNKGNVTEEEYMAYLDEYNYAQTVTAILPVLKTAVIYILGLQEEGKDAYFVYDTGWNTLVGLDFDYLLYGLVLLLFAGAFANEIQGKTHPILKATRKGRGRLFFSKYASMLTLSTILFAAFTAIDLTAAIKAFEFPALDAPIQSITLFGDVASMTVAQFVGLWIAVKWLAVLALVTALMGISLLSGKVLNTMAIVAVVTLMPFLLRRFVLGMVQYFDFPICLAVPSS